MLENGVTFDGYGINARNEHADRILTLSQRLVADKAEGPRIGKAVEKVLNLFVMRRPALAIRLDSGHNHNGNPCRCYLVLDLCGNVLEAVDEGYRGIGGLHSRHPGLPVSVELKVTRKEYRDCLKAYPAKSEQHWLDNIIPPS